MHRLRLECPWDREQSLKTLRNYLIEEAYECIGAIDEAEQSQNYEHLIEELGDVLLQVVFQAELLTEILGSPSMERIIASLNQKLIRRHPHVFDQTKSQTMKDPEAALSQWDQIKRSEQRRADASSTKTVFDEISHSMTSLQRSQKIGARSMRLQFDWQTHKEVWHQVESEMRELAEAGTPQRQEEELGDVFFSLAQWARHSKIDAEVALSGANSRFIRRFKAMLNIGKLDEEEFKNLPPEQKEILWKKAKELEAR